jgi:hypothetical protein
MPQEERGGHNISHSKQKKKLYSVCSCVLFRTLSQMELFHYAVTVQSTDEQHSMSSHELQSSLMLTVQFSKMYHTR